VIAWAVVAVTLLVGSICLYFAKEQRKVNQIKASDVLSQMSLIERRYQDESDKA
jgi:Na+/proline symporter